MNSAKPAISKCKPPLSHHGSKVVNFNKLLHDTSSSKSNMTSEEQKALQSLANDTYFVTEQADKGSCKAVLEREDYIKQAKEQLQDNSVYKDVKFKDHTFKLG